MQNAPLLKLRAKPLRYLQKSVYCLLSTLLLMKHILLAPALLFWLVGSHLSAQQVGPLEIPFPGIPKKVMEMNVKTQSHARSTSTTTFIPASRIQFSWNAGSSLWDSIAWSHYDYFWDGDVMVDSTNTYSGSAWGTFSKDVFAQNAARDIVQRLSYKWNGSGWDTVNAYFYDYTSEGDMSLNGYATYLGGGLFDTLSGWRGFYTYNASGDPLNILWEYYDDLTGMWLKSGQSLYTYGGTGLLDDYVYQSWDGSSYVNSEHYLYTYDPSGEEETFTIQLWSGSSWVNKVRTIDYDWHNYPKGLINYALHQVWDLGVWKDFRRQNYTYGPNDSYVEIEQLYDDSLGWINYARYTLDIDLYGNATLFHTDTATATGWGTLNGYRDTYTYDASGNVLEKVNEVFSDVGGVFDYHNFYKWVYLAYSVGTTPPHAQIEISAVPNPAHDRIQISLPQGIWTLSLLTLTGQHMEAPAFELSPGVYSMELSGLPSGIYLLQAEGEAQRMVSRIVVQ
jgi:hypothetical protein